jgi:hypothetical protein
MSKNYRILEISEVEPSKEELQAYITKCFQHVQRAAGHRLLKQILK